jgi:ABC-type antimicrobial peptide transport system permease subunit
VLVGLGLGIGILGALGMARLLRGLLLGVHPWDPQAFAGVVAVLLLAAFVACLVPARRATRVDPLQALRHE